MTGVVAVAGHGWVAGAFPLAAAVIAAVFGAQLGRQWLARRRAFQGLWALALLMFAVASLAMVIGVVGGWTVAAFRVYWLFGAVLNVPYLAAGEIYLLARRRAVARVCLGALLVGTGFAIWKVLTATIRGGPLGRTLPLGNLTFVDHSAFGAYHLANWLGNTAYAVLILGILWSLWRMRGAPAQRSRVAGTALIAIGATIVAIGSGIGAAFNVVPLFSVGLAAGVAVMFVGFLRVSRPARVAPAA